MSAPESSTPSQRRHRIWVTRELGEEDVAYARSLGLEPVVQPAIRKVMQPPMRQRSVPEAAVWVFTSKSGVAGMSNQRSEGVHLPEPRAVFAVGEQTAAALREVGLPSEWPAEENATGLAHLILRWVDLNPDAGKRGRLPIVHWCGNRSRPELKEVLEQAGHSLKECTVYKTELVSVEPPESPVEAILFYSPSAVEAVRRSNAWPDPMPALYAIGSTTGEALSLESDVPVHIPPKPSTRSLLERVARDLQRLPTGGESTS